MQDNSVQRFILPIKLEMEPMERLLVASFKGDGEFDGFEPQWFDDPTNGTGMRFLRYRKDKTVDVYWQKGVQSAGFALGAGIHDFSETQFEDARFELTPNGVDVHVVFTDVQGRRVELTILEHIKNKRDFHFLAPVGSGVENPDKLFFVHMLGFNFTPVHNTQVKAGVGERALAMDTLPMPFNLHKVYMIRYCSRPVIAALNHDLTQPLLFEAAPSCTVHTEGMAIVLDEAGRVSQLSAGKDDCRAELHFSPSFPDLGSIADNSRAAGSFTVYIAGEEITGGSYGIHRVGNEAAVELKPTKPWHPLKVPVGFRLTMKMIKLFTHWPTTYRWSGVVSLTGEHTIAGGWERTDT